MNTGLSDTQPVKTANKRGAARLAAVQALYQLDLSRTRVEDVILEYETSRIGQELDGETYLDADKSWFRGIVTGVVAEQKTLDPLIHAALPEDWPLARVDTLLRSLLRAGVFELLKRPDVPVAVVINEYLDVAKAFYDNEEPRLINAVLDAIAHDRRPEAFEKTRGPNQGD